MAAWSKLFEIFIFYPAVGVILLLVAQAAAQRAFKDGARQWVTYAWALGAGFILSNFHLLIVGAGGW